MRHPLLSIIAAFGLALLGPTHTSEAKTLERWRDSFAFHHNELAMLSEGGSPHTECMSDCLDSCDGGSQCEHQCIQQCSAGPTPSCHDESDPNYHWCMGGVLSWEASCYLVTFPLVAGALLACAANGEDTCSIELTFQDHPCTILANEMRTQCTPTRRVCDG